MKNSMKHQVSRHAPVGDRVLSHASRNVANRKSEKLCLRTKSKNVAVGSGTLIPRAEIISVVPIRVPVGSQTHLENISDSSCFVSKRFMSSPSDAPVMKAEIWAGAVP